MDKPKIGNRYTDKHGDEWLFAYAEDNLPIVIRIKDGQVGNWYDGENLEEIKPLT